MRPFCSFHAYFILPFIGAQIVIIKTMAITKTMATINKIMVIIKTMAITKTMVTINKIMAIIKKMTKSEQSFAKV